MRRVLALAVLVAFLPTTNAQEANTAEKSKADVSFSGEYRLQSLWGQNPGANKNIIHDVATTYSRFKLNANVKVGDDLTGRLGVLHNAYFGNDASEPTVGKDNGLATNRSGVETTAENVLTVSEAWVNWKTSDDFSFRLGRQPFAFGDGYVMGINDAEVIPFSYEGGVATYDAGFGTFQGFLFKFRDWGNNLALTNPYPLAGSSATGVPEHNALGLVFDLKSKLEWLKAVNVHLIKDSANGIVGTTSTVTDVDAQNGQNILRYGAEVSTSFSIIDVKAWYAALKGKITDIAANTATKTELDATGSMMQAEVAANFKEFAYSRVWARYHRDSGDKDATDKKSEGYDPYKYNQYPNSGGMGLVRWGNLTAIAAGFSFMTSEKTQWGASYWRFSRTETGAFSQAPTIGSLGGFVPSTDGKTANLGDRTKSGLGAEIDAYVWHGFSEHLSASMLVGSFTPGEYFKSSAAPFRAPDSGLLVLGSGTFTF